MKFFNRQKELLLEYFQTTPLIVIIFDIGFSIFSLAGTIYGYIKSNTLFLLISFIVVVLFFLIIIYRIKRNYINLKSLYLDENTFLSHMVANITEVRRLKEKEKINNVNVNKLEVNFKINEPVPKETLIKSSKL